MILSHAPTPLAANGLDMHVGHPAALEGGSIVKRGSHASAPLYDAPDMLTECPEYATIRSRVGWRNLVIRPNSGPGGKPTFAIVLLVGLPACWLAGFDQHSGGHQVAVGREIIVA